jgi:hypothetical protein
MSSTPGRRSRTHNQPTQAEKVSSPSQAEPVEKLWTRRGVEDVYFQREAQLTWWSVLGGIAVAALLTRLESLPGEFGAGRWYVVFYLLATCLAIINAWVQTAWGSLVLKWPISIPTSITIFIHGISLSVAALYITRPAIWYAALSRVLLTHQFDQWYFSKSGAWIAMPRERVDQLRKNSLFYSFMAIFGIASSIFLAMQPVFMAELGGGIIALLLAIGALVLQHVGMAEEKRRLGVA